MTALTSAVVLVSSTARAEPLELGASVGWAAPIGSAARGARTSDTTIGLVPLQFDAGWRFTRDLGVALAASYGFGVPTLCATAADCEASLGTDVTLAARARFFLPRLGPTAAMLDAGLGWEWLTTRFSDAGARASRGYAGPVLLSAELFAPFDLSPRWTLGPALGASVATFTTESLDPNATAATATSGGVHGRALHGWLSLAVRIGWR